MLRVTIRVLLVGKTNNEKADTDTDTDTDTDGQTTMSLLSLTDVISCFPFGCDCLVLVIVGTDRRLCCYYFQSER